MDLVGDRRWRPINLLDPTAGTSENSLDDQFQSTPAAGETARYPLHPSIHPRRLNMGAVIAGRARTGSSSFCASAAALSGRDLPKHRTEDVERGEAAILEDGAQPPRSLLWPMPGAST